MTVTNPRRSASDASDSCLVTDVASVLTTPREDPADSFVLHAPLELVARAALVPFVAPAQRARARDRISDIAVEFEKYGPPVAEPVEDDHDSATSASTALVAALDRGELDDVDRVARWLGRAATGLELRELLATDLVQRLAAAAHAPIFLFELPRVAPRGEVTGELLRGLARELGREPDWRLRWMDDGSAAEPGDSAEAMLDAIAGTPLGARDPGESPFIHPVMSRVDELGIAADQLATVIGSGAITERAHSVLRAAAWSMLLEPGDHSPYGWSHCLTMPQAVLGLADVVEPRVALSVAATFVVGFRSAFAVNPLQPVFPHDDPRVPLAEAFIAGPTIAAAAVWHDRTTPTSALVTELATRAAIHGDAHLAKYTLACIDQAEADRQFARLYLAAAASLVGWWTQLDPSIAPT